MALLECKNVSYRQGDRDILSGVNLSVETGEFISVVGPSGSGKSTFLRLCSHLISPASGRILFDGRDMREWEPTQLRKKAAYCPQTPCLFGEKVKDDLEFPFLIRKKKIDTDRVEELFSLFHMKEGMLYEDTKKLSGGEKQRIALIRTLLFEPCLLLLDEVTSALDHDNKILVEQGIHRMNKKGVTVMWITHDGRQSERYAGRRLCFEGGILKKVEVIR